MAKFGTKEFPANTPTYLQSGEQYTDVDYGDSFSRRVPYKFFKEH